MAGNEAWRDAIVEGAIILGRADTAAADTSNEAGVLALAAAQEYVTSLISTTSFKWMIGHVGCSCRRKHRRES